MPTFCVGHPIFGTVERNGKLQLTGRRLGAMVLKGLAAGAAFLIVGNLAILGASVWARETSSAVAPSEMQGVDNLRAVDREVWRGAAPTGDGYRNLARAGVATVVDLRAEENLDADFRLVRELGMNLVHIPIRDGQAPSTDEVAAFLDATRSAGDGKVFVHCGAGVGRTGAMVGAYQIASGEARPGGALRQNLAVGPPSLEQMAFVAGLDDGRVEKPGPVLTAMSRVLDAPRRLWSRVS